MTKRIALALVAVMLALVVSGGVLLANNSFVPSIARWTTANGGRSSGGSYSLDSAIGQAAAGPALRGGGYQIVSGYLAAPDNAGGQRVYLPMTQR